MSQSSPILSLPYIQPAQAQKHVTHNEALRVLDAITQLTVISADLMTPPQTPTAGDRYIVAGPAADDWAGQEGTIAVWVDSTWQFFTPQTGWRADVTGTAETLRFDGGVWQLLQPDFQNVPLVGVNAAADPGNRLTVSSDATLLNNAGAGHQLKLNKAGATETASLLFQTGFSGRAEMGTAGNDDFSIKVSADGLTYATALAADTSGAVQFPGGQSFFQEASIGNDAAWSIDIAWADPARILMWLAADLADHAFLVAITGPLVGASNFAEIFAGQSSVLGFQSGPLTGTTGPAGALTLAVDVTGAAPKLWIENRLGAAQTITLATLGR